MLQTFAASYPLSTEPLKQSRSTVDVDTTLFSDLQVHQLTRRFPTLSVVAKYDHGNVGAVIECNHTNSWAGLDLLSSLLVLQCTYFPQ